MPGRVWVFWGPRVPNWTLRFPCLVKFFGGSRPGVLVFGRIGPDRCWTACGRFSEEQLTPKVVGTPPSLRVSAACAATAPWVARSCRLGGWARGFGVKVLQGYTC